MPNVAVNLMKHVMEHIRLKAEEEVEAELFKQYGADPQGLVSALQREALVAMKVAQYYQEVKQMQTQMQGNQEDPLVGLKKQELEQNAQRDQAKLQLDQQHLTLDQEREMADQAEAAAKLQLDREKFAAQHGVQHRQIDQKGVQHANQLTHQAIQNAQQISQQNADRAAQAQQAREPAA
jgi:hypothetical protein